MITCWACREMITVSAIRENDGDCPKCEQEIEGYDETVTLPEIEEVGRWQDCWNCGGERYSHHDCGEDTCCCLDPEDNVLCDICRGKGGWNVDLERVPHE